MLKLLLKFLLALALCFWLFTNGKLDFTLIIKAFQIGHMWILGVFFLSIRFVVSSLRFKVLLETKTLNKIGFLKIFLFDAVGNFFSVIIPGSVGGDLVRYTYYRNLSKELSKTTLASLLMLDRLIGLLALMALGISACLIQIDSIRLMNPKLLTFVYFNGLFFLGVLIFITGFFSHIIPQEKILRPFFNYISKWPKISSSLKDMLTVNLKLVPFLKCFILSLLNQILIIAGFWGLASPFLPSNTPFLNLLTVIPIGMIGTALPISPAGLGVGHVLFDNLFKMLSINNGASLFNLFFVANLMICLMGIFPYLFIQNDLKKK